MKAAACTSSNRSGASKTETAGAMAYSAIPPSAVLVMATTRRPSHDSAPSPVASTTPHTSMPRVNGGGVGTDTNVPRHRSMSLKLSDAAPTFTRTSPGPGSGRSTVRTASTSPGLPCAVTCRAYMSVIVTPPVPVRNGRETARPYCLTGGRVVPVCASKAGRNHDASWARDLVRMPAPVSGHHGIGDEDADDPVDQVRQVPLREQAVGQGRGHQGSDTGLTDAPEGVRADGPSCGPRRGFTPECGGVDGPVPDLPDAVHHPFEDALGRLVHAGAVETPLCVGRHLLRLPGENGEEDGLVAAAPPIEGGARDPRRSGDVRRGGLGHAESLVARRRGIQDLVDSCLRAALDRHGLLARGVDGESPIRRSRRRAVTARPPRRRPGSGLGARRE